MTAFSQSNQTFNSSGANAAAEEHGGALKRLFSHTDDESSSPLGVNAVVVDAPFEQYVHAEQERVLEPLKKRQRAIPLEDIRDAIMDDEDDLDFASSHANSVTKNHSLDSEGIMQYEEQDECIPYDCDESYSFFAKISYLPIHLLATIFAYFPQTLVLRNLTQVCRRWYCVAKYQSPQIWRKIDFNQVLDELRDSDMQQLTLPLSFFHRFGMNHVILFFSALVTKNVKCLPNRQGSMHVGDDRYGRHRLPHSEVILPKNCSHLNVKNFQKFRKMFPNLISISLPPIYSIQSQSHSGHSGIHSISDACLKPIGTFSFLQHVNFATHTGITDIGLISFLRSVPQLNSINLDYCTGLTANVFDAIIQLCPNIKSISMIGNPNAILEKKHIYDAFGSISKRYGINYLHLEFGPSIDYESYKTLVAKVPNLKTLLLRECSQVDGRTLQLLSSELFYIENLDLCCKRGVRIYSSVIDSLTLKHLRIGKTDGIVKAVFKCPNLLSVSFEQCNEIRGCEFVNCNKLQEVKLRSCDLTSLSVNNLFGILDQIKDLEIFDCRLALAAVCLNSAQLRKLMLFMCNDMNTLALNCPQLTTLNIDVCMALESMALKCPQLESVQLFALPQMHQPKLSQFHLESSRIISLNLQKTTNLQKISLRCSALDSLNLANCRTLLEMNLDCPRLDKLALGSTDFKYDPNFIQQLSRTCPAVSMLSISNSNFMTDTCLAIFCNSLPLLQALVITNCHKLKFPVLQAPSLKGIQITECSDIRSITVQSSSLAKLFLRNCPSIDDDSIKQLGTTCPTIRFLEVYNCSSIKTPYIGFKEVTDLHFSKCDNLVYPIINATSLRKLLFLSCVGLKQIKFLQNCEALTEILFSDCPQVADATIHSLKTHAANIQALVLSKCDSIMAPSVQFSNLKIIRFSDCPQLAKPRIRYDSVNPLSVLALQDCPALEITKFSDIFEKQQGSRVHVDSVEISQCENIQEFEIDINASRINITSCDALQEILISTGEVEKIKVEGCDSLLQIFCAGTTKLNEIIVRRCPELSTVDVKPLLQQSTCQLKQEACFNQYNPDGTNVESELHIQQQILNRVSPSVFGNEQAHTPTTLILASTIPSSQDNGFCSGHSDCKLSVISFEAPGSRQTMFRQDSKIAQVSPVLEQQLLQQHQLQQRLQQTRESGSNKSAAKVSDSTHIHSSGFTGLKQADQSKSCHPNSGSTLYNQSVSISYFSTTSTQSQSAHAHNELLPMRTNTITAIGKNPDHEAQALSPVIDPNMHYMKVSQRNSQQLHIHAFTNMRKLEFTQCPRISDLCITSLLTKFQHLEHLEIVECGLTNPIIVQQLLSETRNLSLNLHQAPRHDSHPHHK